MEICEYAHRNQIRENGDLYLVHPCRCLGYYRHMVGIKENDPFCIDVDLMEKYDIPYNGIQELCLLHDVIEDTDFTMEDLKEIFDECKLLDHFNMYIEKPLDIITHRKEESYDIYIDKCLKNRSAALVKMCDLNDNLDVTTLISFDDYKYDRCCRYLKYINIINNKYHFIENINEYHEHFLD